MRDYAGSALMMAITTLVGIGCYSATAHGASERDAIQKMRRQLVADSRAVRDLEAELRIRARLPQLERWNDEVLKMSAPASVQFMRSPVQLASLVNPAKPEAPAAETAPALQYAVTPAQPAAPSAATVVRVRLDATPLATPPARLMLTGFPDPNKVAAPAPAGAP
jgi:hypothetical protein